MNWVEAKITTTSAGTDLLTGVLMGLGINGFVIEDPNDFESFLTDPNIYKDYVDDELWSLRDATPSVTVYLPENDQGADMLRAIKDELARLRRMDAGQLGADVGALELSLGNVREEDWENCWKKYFKPLPVGDRFLIKPSWEELPGPTDRIVLEIDPSSSFGTGSHETTRLCIEALEKTVFPGCSLLDMGCGSGILGMAAALLGAGDITAVDIDANAIRIAGENFGRIPVSPKLRLLCGNALANDDAARGLRSALAEKRYDVIAANIVADVILGMRELFSELLAPDGVLLLSGIISERADEVADGVSAAGFRIDSVSERGGWVEITARHSA